MCNPHADSTIPELARAPSWLNASERLQKRAQERRRNSLEAISESSLSPDGSCWSRVRTSVGVRRNSITGGNRVIVRPKTPPMQLRQMPQAKPGPRKAELPAATKAATKRAEKAAKAAEAKKEANQRQLKAEAAKQAEEEAWARREAQLAAEAKAEAARAEVRRVRARLDLKTKSRMDKVHAKRGLGKGMGLFLDYEAVAAVMSTQNPGGAPAAVVARNRKSAEQKDALGQSKSTNVGLQGLQRTPSVSCLV